MKKLYSIFAIAAGCLVLATSCGDDNDYQPKVNSVSVVSAETELAAAGESKTITVEGTGITASLPAEVTWLTAAVSGNQITVTAQPNLSNETRHALLTVRASNGDETAVNFSQMGAYFSVDAPTVIHLTDGTETVKLDAKYNLPLTVSSSESWLKVSVDDANSQIVLTPEANTTGNQRFAEINYSIGNVEGSINVAQWEFDNDILGNYTLYYYSSGWKTTPVSLERATNGSVQIRLLDEGYAAYNLVIPTTTDEENLSMVIDNLAPMGTVTLGETTYQALVFIRGVSGNSIYRSRNPWAMVGDYVAYDDGTFYWEFDGNTTMLSAGYEWYGMSIGLTTDGTYAGYQGFYTPHFYYFTLEKAE